MSAHDRLHSAYAEWHRLATAEGEAIRTGNWTAVDECQTLMQKLQPEIILFTQEVRREWAMPGSEHDADERALREAVSELIELERRNSALLHDFRKTARAELHQVEQTGKTLRQVQRSYAPARQAAWTSFS